MDMSGTGTAAASAIILIGLMMGLMAAQPSLDNAMEHMKEVKDDSRDLSTTLASTDISISYASFNNTTSVLNVTVRNDGSTIMETNGVDILVNGTIESWTPDEIYLYPSREMRISILNITDPRSVLVVERYGLSDHTETIITT